MAKFKSLNIGDTVRLVSLADTGDRCGYTEALEQHVGGTFEVTELDRQFSTNLGQVKLSCGWWFSPKGLEVLTPTEPTPEPVVHTTDDFKYTRVRAKDTGAEGVVVGRSKGGSIAVLHDYEARDYHDGNGHEVGFVGVQDRIYYYQVLELEIIGGVQ